MSGYEGYSPGESDMNFSAGGEKNTDMQESREAQPAVNETRDSGEESTYSSDTQVSDVMQPKSEGMLSMSGAAYFSEETSETTTEEPQAEEIEPQPETDEVMDNREDQQEAQAYPGDVSDELSNREDQREQMSTEQADQPPTTATGNRYEVKERQSDETEYLTRSNYEELPDREAPQDTTVTHQPPPDDVSDDAVSDQNQPYRPADARYEYTDVSVKGLPVPENINGPEDFKKITYEHCMDECKQLPDVMNKVKSGWTKDDFIKADAAAGLSDSPTRSTRVYELFYGGDPVVVDQNSDGSYSDYTSGRHRVYMAQHLGLDNIPVVVRSASG